MNKPLTLKQEKFVQLVVDGNKQVDAYRKTYTQNKMGSKAITEKASAMMGMVNVRARFNELKDALANKALWSREESVKALKTVLESPDKATDIVAAVKELNAMHGYNAPQKVEIEHRGAVNIYVPELSYDE